MEALTQLFNSFVDHDLYEENKKVFSAMTTEELCDFIRDPCLAGTDEYVLRSYIARNQKMLFPKCNLKEDFFKKYSDKSLREDFEKIFSDETKFYGNLVCPREIIDFVSGKLNEVKSNKKIDEIIKWDELLTARDPKKNRGQDIDTINAISFVLDFNLPDYLKYYCTLKYEGINVHDCEQLARIACFQFDIINNYSCYKKLSNRIKETYEDAFCDLLFGDDSRKGNRDLCKKELCEERDEKHRRIIMNLWRNATTAYPKDAEMAKVLYEEMIKIVREQSWGTTRSTDRFFAALWCPNDFEQQEEVFYSGVFRDYSDYKKWKKDDPKRSNEHDDYSDYTKSVVLKKEIRKNLKRSHDLYPRYSMEAGKLFQDLMTVYKTEEAKEKQPDKRVEERFFAAWENHDDFSKQRYEFESGNWCRTAEYKDIRKKSIDKEVKEQRIKKEQLKLLSVGYTEEMNNLDLPICNSEDEMIEAITNKIKVMAGELTMAGYRIDGEQFDGSKTAEQLFANMTRDLETLIGGVDDMMSKKLDEEIEIQENRRRTTSKKDRLTIPGILTHVRHELHIADNEPDTEIKSEGDFVIKEFFRVYLQQMRMGSDKRKNNDRTSSAVNGRKQPSRKIFLWTALLLYIFMRDDCRGTYGDGYYYFDKIKTLDDEKKSAVYYELEKAVSIEDDLDMADYDRDISFDEEAAPIIDFFNLFLDEAGYMHIYTANPLDRFVVSAALIPARPIIKDAEPLSSISFMLFDKVFDLDEIEDE